MTTHGAEPRDDHVRIWSRGALEAWILSFWSTIVAPSIGWVLAVFVFPDGGPASLYVVGFLLIPALLAIGLGLSMRCGARSLVFALLAAGMGAIAWIATAIWLEQTGVFRT